MSDPAKKAFIMFANTEGLMKQVVLASILVVHVSITLYLFYEIIFSGFTNRYDDLMNKIQNGLSAAISLISVSFTIWYYDVIKSTFDNLYKIDYTMESIGMKKAITQPLATTTKMTVAKTVTKKPATKSKSVEIGLSCAMMLTYFCTKYMRYRYLTSYDIAASLRHSFTRTCCLTFGEFVLITFIKSLEAGRQRFATLNRWINEEIDEGKLILNSRESDEINSIYFDIMSFCDLILTSYQIQIFLTLISDIVIVIYMVLTAFNEFVSGSVAFIAIVFCIVDPVIRLSQIVRVMSTATATILEAQNMANCLQRLLIETSMNIMTREKLNLFLMELVDKKMQFTVCGFLSLNNGTLVVMTGTVSTYLLIMMQFQPPID